MRGGNRGSILKERETEEGPLHPGLGWEPEITELPPLTTKEEVEGLRIWGSRKFLKKGKGAYSVSMIRKNLNRVSEIWDEQNQKWNGLIVKNLTEQEEHRLLVQPREFFKNGEWVGTLQNGRGDQIEFVYKVIDVIRSEIIIEWWEVQENNVLQRRNWTGQEHKDSLIRVEVEVQGDLKKLKGIVREEEQTSWENIGIVVNEGWLPIDSYSCKDGYNSYMKRHHDKEGKEIKLAVKVGLEINWEERWTLFAKDKYMDRKTKDLVWFF